MGICQRYRKPGNCQLRQQGGLAPTTVHFDVEDRETAHQVLVPGGNRRMRVCSLAPQVICVHQKSGRSGFTAIRENTYSTDSTMAVYKYCKNCLTRLGTAPHPSSWSPGQ